MKGSLKRHIREQHGDIEPLKCRFCDYKTTRKGNLKRHIGESHSSSVRKLKQEHASTSVRSPERKETHQLAVC